MQFNNIDHKHRYYYEKKLHNPIDLAYLAGIIDGEGCFHACKLKNKPNDGYKNGHYRCILKVTNTNKNLFEWLQFTFRGTCCSASKKNRKHVNRKDIYEWTVTGHRLLDICHQVLPYLIIKKRHCELIIQFRETFPLTLGRGTRELSTETLNLRDSIVQEIRQLNARPHMPHYVKLN